jgi:hypothetical protein
LILSDEAYESTSASRAPPQLLNDWQKNGSYGIQMAREVVRRPGMIRYSLAV